VGVEADKYHKIYQFKVEIDGVEAGGFRAADGLTVQREVVELEEGGENTRHHKLVGPTRWSNIVLRQGSSDSMDLWDWIKKAIDGTVERKCGSIMACNRAGDVVTRWDFRDAWPCRYEGADFIADGSELPIELLELAHNGFEKTK
jgi:phage tail-like protein